MWDDIASAVATCSEGSYVKVQGQVSKYQGKWQITLTKMRLAAETEVEAADFVPASQFDIGEMWAELRGYVDEFENAELRRLVFAFLDDEEIGAAYRAAPAAKVLHHAWIGGLLEHVVALARVCRATAPFYPEVDRDLLVTGAILHDIGKTRELYWGTTFGYTLEGQMIGHISIAQGMLREKVAGLPGFPDKLRVLVEHMILSHHGRYEFGSPKLPMTPEAMLLSALDDVEAKFAAMRREFAAAEASGKKADETTEWVRSMERPLLNSRAYLEDSGITPAIQPPQIRIPSPIAERSTENESEVSPVTEQSLSSTSSNRNEQLTLQTESLQRPSFLRRLQKKVTGQTEATPAAKTDCDLQAEYVEKLQYWANRSGLDLSSPLRVPPTDAFRSDPRYLNGCAQKQRHEDRETAESFLDWANRRYGDDGQRVYQCDFCGGWHLGHPRVDRPGI
jgi:3'-5' exoribonuclease